MAVFVVLAVLVVLIVVQAMIIVVLWRNRGQPVEHSGAATDSIYFTDRGTVAHSSRQCAAIRASKNVRVLSLCKKCAGHLRVAAWVETQVDKQE